MILETTPIYAKTDSAVKSVDKCVAKDIGDKSITYDTLSCVRILFHV